MKKRGGAREEADDARDKRRKCEAPDECGRARKKGERERVMVREERETNSKSS